MARFRGPVPILQVKNLPASLRFYRDLLGFRQDYSFPDYEPAFIHLKTEGGTVGLTKATEPVLAASTSIWISCDDVDAAISELRDAGVTIKSEPVDQPWGQRVASVADPDGYTVIIGEPA